MVLLSIFVRRLRMVTKKENYDHDKYEYKRVYHTLTRYTMLESKDPSHRFNYIQRVPIGYSFMAKYSSFKAFCNCGWKSDVWQHTKNNAII